jgi:hypothetical protein
VAIDPVRELIASIRTRVEAELDAHAPDVAARYAETIAVVGKEAVAAADRRWAALLDTHKSQARQELQAAVDAVRAEGQQGSNLLDAFRTIDAASSVSEVLSTLTDAATARSIRAALFVGPHLEPWRGESAPPAELLRTVQKALATSDTVSDAANGVAVPVLLDGVSVAVLYAQAERASDGWLATIELLVRYSAAHLGYVTALRTAQAQRWLAPSRTAVSAAGTSQSSAAVPESESQDTVQSAKRYARLLVSEIKLYNEAAVREGREARDLTRRLGAEIDRAQRLYEERVPPTVPDRARHFHHELVQTLAGGDPALLG